MEQKNNELAGQAEVKCDYDMLMPLLGVSVSKHLLDEYLTCVWANEYFYHLIGYTKTEFQDLYHNRPSEYLANNQEGLKLLVESIQEALKREEKGTSVYLPLISLGGGECWIKLQVAFMDEYIDGYRAAYTTMTDVTEMMQARQEQEKTRKDLEEMIHEQEMLMSILKVSVSKHIIDEHYTCVRANEYYYQLIGYPKDKYEALFHNHPDEYYSNNPEGWDILTKKVTEVLENGGDQYEIIAPMKYEDGTSFWVKLFSYFTDEYINGYRCTYTVMTDVTELVQMKNEQEILMRAMKVSVSRHLVDEHFTVIWANNFYYEMIGYSKNEYEAMFHRHCDEYFKNNESSWDQINEKIHDMQAAGKKSYETFIPLRIPDGSTRWVKMTGFFTDEYQDGTQMAYTTMVDVTDLMQVQQEKAVAYDNIPGFIVKHRILSDGIIMMSASEGITEYFNVDIGQLSSFDICSVMSQESRELIEGNHSHFRKGEPFEGTIYCEDSYGRNRSFQIRSICIDTVSDDPVFLTICIDITDVTELRELKYQLEERTKLLNSALEEAKRANAAKSDFLSRMSHDIRTPMNAILGMTTIAAAHLQDSERIQDCLDKIGVSSKLLLSLINEVLDMSKIESGKMVLAEEEVNLADLVQGVVTMVQPMIKDKNLVFETYANKITHEMLISDMQRLQQLLLNLLSNAVKYTPDHGKILLDINEIPSETAGASCFEFVVTDSGIGMTPDFMERVFEPFERADDEAIQSVQGTGLGLSICKSIAELMGGTIQAESAYGHGSKFTATVCLPIQEASVDDRVLSGLTVLVVDDETLCHNICGRLDELGMVSEWVTDGWSALEKVEKAHIADQDYFTVIIDYKMPGLNGIEITRLIRKKVGPDLPVIIISAYDLSDQMDEARQVGADGFITKPLFRSRLAYKLKQFVENSGVQVPKEPQLLSGSYEGKRVLLVEDNQLNQEIACEILSSAGVTVETAINGKMAVELVKESPAGTYDLIFMDMQMPVMDGCTATRKIRSLPLDYAKELPIIAMTANAFEDDRQKTREAGMNGHLSKPIDMKQLHQVLQKWLS